MQIFFSSQKQESRFDKRLWIRNIIYLKHFKDKPL